MRKLMLFALSFCVALTLAVTVLSGKWALILAGVCAVLFLVLVLLRERRLAAVAICLIAACLGFVWCAGYRALFFAKAQRYDQQPLQINALVLDAPMESVYGCSVCVEVELEGTGYQTVLYLDEDHMDLMPGDRIRCLARLKLTPGQIQGDDNRYYRSRGIWFTASARSDVYVMPAQTVTLRHVPMLFSLKLQEALKTVFPEDTAGFLVAILTGDREGLDYATRNMLSISGIYHTVAVSGMHVSILIGMIVLLCGPRRKLAAGIGIPVIVFFVLMVGAPASAVRAGLMQGFLLLAPLLDRENDPFTSLSAALMMLLAIDPWSIYNVGLQLSFASVAGILLFASELYERASKKKWVAAALRGRGVFRWLVKAMLTSFCSTMSAMAFSLPLAAFYFDSISLVSPIVNVLTLWAVTICFTAGILISLLALVLQPAAIPLAWLLSWLVRYVLAVAEFFASLPFAAVYTNSIYMTAWCALAYGALLLYFIPRHKYRVLPAVVSLTAALLLCIGMARLDYDHPAFSLTALDVGQGQCLIYRCGDRTAVIDCGGSHPAAAGEKAARFLQSAGYTRIDALILTHYDEDHVGGAAQLLQRVSVGTVYLPDTEDEMGEQDLIIEAALQAGSDISIVAVDTQLPFGGGTLALYAPTDGASGNEAGLGILASAGEYDILVTGDLDTDMEYRLLQTRDMPDIELLVAGHHGARTSTGYALLQKTKPETVLISVEADNPYGHPAPETLDRIRTSGAVVYRTDQCGTITIRGN